MVRNCQPVGRRSVAVVSLAVLSFLAACSGGDGGSDADSSTAPTATTDAPASGSGTPNAAFVDVTECENESGSGTAKGTIVNNGTTDTGYKITIAFRDGSGEQLATGSATTGLVAAGAEVDWTVEAVGLGSVSSADLTCSTVSIEPLEAAASTTAAAAGSTDGEFPCDLLTPDEVAQIAGNPLDGDALTSPTTEGDLSWTARQCVWSAAPSTSSVELTLSVSRPADFPTGASTCPPPIGVPTTVPGIGTSATWSWTDPGTEVKIGELRVCSPDAFVVVRVSGATNDPQQRQVATSVAEKALVALSS